MLSSTTITDILPAASALPLGMGARSLSWLYAFIYFSGTLIQISTALYRVKKHVGSDAFWSDAFLGLMPMASWIAMVFNVITMTEWGQQNPCLVLVLMTPGYCLINSKLIVCCFTKMEVETISKNFGIFVLLNLNAFLDRPIEDWYVVCLVFAVETLTYLIFVFCTIGQITKHLDIYCLTIKVKKEQKQA